MTTAEIRRHLHSIARNLEDRNTRGAIDSKPFTESDVILLETDIDCLRGILGWVRRSVAEREEG